MNDKPRRPKLAPLRPVTTDDTVFPNIIPNTPSTEYECITPASFKGFGPQFGTESGVLPIEPNREIKSQKDYQQHQVYEETKPYSISYPNHRVSGNFSSVGCPCNTITPSTGTIGGWTVKPEYMIPEKKPSRAKELFRVKFNKILKNL